MSCYKANDTYSEAVSFDPLARPTEINSTRSSDSTLLFDARRAFDPVGNVANVWTTLPTGTDYQAFCYDEQNRLTWASSASGSVPCGGAWTAGSLTNAIYTNTYSYDALDRLTSGPGGSYTYGNSAHLDAATAIGSGYTAAYDAAGNMTCRAPTNTRTCAGTQTGAQLTYDSEGRLSAWQDAPGLHSTATSNLYDGEGHRVAQQVTTGLPSNPSTTAITYVSKVEELSSTAGTTTTTTSYYAAGQRIAQAVNGVFSYLGSDGLGSAQVALDASGNPTASVLYAPYGQARYTSGTMPGSYGYTGQHSDGATGLDYYNARYYDPVAGQFISADSVQDGLNRYAYVHGNPTTRTDPTGHRVACDDGGSGGSPPPQGPILSPLNQDGTQDSTPAPHKVDRRLQKQESLAVVVSDRLSGMNVIQCVRNCLTAEVTDSADVQVACKDCVEALHTIITSGLPWVAILISVGLILRNSNECKACFGLPQVGARAYNCILGCFGKGGPTPPSATQPSPVVLPTPAPAPPAWWPSWLPYFPGVGPGGDPVPVEPVFP